MSAVFVTNQYGAKVLFDSKGLIGKFRNSNNNIVTSDDGIKRRNPNTPELWYMILENEDKIQRAREYPGFGKMFDETKDEPVWNTLGNLKTLGDPSKAKEQKPVIQADVEAKLKDNSEEIKKQYATKSRRYGELFSLVCKSGGEILKNADPMLVAEFKQLQVELGISEKEVLEEATS